MIGHILMPLGAVVEGTHVTMETHSRPLKVAALALALLGAVLVVRGLRK